MKFAITIDVEEEGLFSGLYSPNDAPATNIFELDRLDRIFMDLGVRPTLLVSYQVAKKPACLNKLFTLTQRWNGEIGAHLHHWNTPPIVYNPAPPPVPSELMSMDLLESKTLSLIEILSTIGKTPTSFRMGRFNMGPKMLQVLEKIGVKVDSSVTPMRKAYGGADHLCAPTDPYFPNPLEPTQKGESLVLEVPVTVLPIFNEIGQYFERLSNVSLIPGGVAEWLSMNLGSIACQPAWVNLGIAKAGVMLHKSRGGECVTVFFHSSELTPKMNPLNPTEEDVQKFIKRLYLFIRWIQKRYNAQCLTLSELYPVYESRRTSSL
ncbi:MAG: hypothetical protein ACP5VS_02555 [Desulfomonilaceae bacterium]